MTGDFQTTLVLLKPGALRRRLAGAILSRFETKGLSIVGCKLMRPDRALVEEHYREHRGKPFYDGLVAFLTDRAVMAMVLEGVDAVAVVRTMVGATNGRDAAPGTIRGDHGMSQRCNLVHASDSAASAEQEIALWFDSAEIVGVDPKTLEGIYDFGDGRPI
ncbi:MAG: nucleoside-diphosphate kinase [Planctomycetota bacterium]